MLSWVLLSCSISQSTTRTLAVLVVGRQGAAETNPEDSFSPSPGVRSLRSECQWGWFLLRTLQEIGYMPLSDLQVTTVFLSTYRCQSIVARHSHGHLGHLVRTAGMLEGPLVQFSTSSLWGRRCCELGSYYTAQGALELLGSGNPLTSAIKVPGAVSHGHSHCSECAMLGLESGASCV